MDIKYIFFDFGGTLAHRGKRHTFIYSNNQKQSRSVLKNDTVSTLTKLKQKGYKLGLLSNTSYSDQQMQQGLQKSGLNKLFDCKIYSSDPNLCAKPCAKIFKKAQQCSGVKSPHQLLYVGNNYEKDVIAASYQGWKTAYLTNTDFDYLMSQSGMQDYTLRKLSDLTFLLKQKA